MIHGALEDEQLIIYCDSYNPCPAEQNLAWRSCDRELRCGGLNEEYATFWCEPSQRTRPGRGLILRDKVANWLLEVATWECVISPQTTLEILREIEISANRGKPMVLYYRMGSSRLSARL